MPFPGCEIEERADGSRGFQLADPVLTFIRIDGQARLQFGEAELWMEQPFVLRMAGQQHALDPADRGRLGPLLELWPDTLVSAEMTPSGTLFVTFESGASIEAPPHDLYESWHLGGFDCVPGGFGPS